MKPIPTPRLSLAMQAGNSDTLQLLEIAANEVPSGDLRDLLLSTGRMNSNLKERLTIALTALEIEHGKEYLTCAPEFKKPVLSGITD